MSFTPTFPPYINLLVLIVLIMYCICCNTQISLIWINKIIFFTNNLSTFYDSALNVVINLLEFASVCSVC